MEMQFKKTLVVLALVLTTAEAAAQAASSANAGAAFNRRISDTQEVSQRQRAADSATILLYRADTNRDERIGRDEFVATERADAEERFALRDIDGDGMLRRDEIGPDRDRPERERPGLDVNIVLYRLCMAMASGEPPVYEDRFAEADLNGDGVLSLFEFSSWLEERAHDQFARLDKNQDGVLTPDELTDSFERRDYHRRLARACRELASDGSF
jgi:hypothetical protein